jgi:hypothetical protein
MEVFAMGGPIISPSDEHLKIKDPKIDVLIQLGH